MTIGAMGIFLILFLMAFHDLCYRTVPRQWVSCLFLWLICFEFGYVEGVLQNIFLAYAFYQGIHGAMCLFFKRQLLGSGDVKILAILSPYVFEDMFSLWLMLLGGCGILFGLSWYYFQHNRVVPFVPAIFLSFLGLEIVKSLL